MPTGTSRWRSRKPRDQVEAVADPDAGGERALRRGLDHRPVGDRIGEGNPDLDHVGAALDHARRAAARWFRRSGSPSIRNAPNAPSPPQPLEHRGVAAHAEQRLRLGDVLVAAAGQADEDRAVRLLLRRASAHERARARTSNAQRMPSLLGERLERGERFGVGRADIFRAAAVLEMRVLGPDRGIIEARPTPTRCRRSARRHPAGRRSRRRGGCRACRAARSRHAPRRRGPCRPPRRRSAARRRR